MRADPPFPFRYRRLAHVALDVMDLPRSLRFYQDLLGLELVASHETAAHFRGGDGHQDLVLHASRRRGLRRVAYQVDSIADLDLAFAHFERAGLEPLPVPRVEQALSGQGRSFRVREPSSGAQFELFAPLSLGEEIPTPCIPGVACILRLGHVVIASPREKETQRTLVDVFGFRLSDVVEGHCAFFRAYPDPVTCSLAVGLGPRNLLPTVSFVVSAIEHIGRFLDPDGITVECNIDVDEACDAAASREAEVWTRSA